MMKNMKFAKDNAHGGPAGGSFAGKKLEPGSPAFAVLQKAGGVAIDALKNYHKNTETVAIECDKRLSLDLKLNGLSMYYIGQNEDMPKILQEKVVAALAAAGLLDTEHGRIEVNVPYFAVRLQKGKNPYWDSACHLSFAAEDKAAMQRAADIVKNTVEQLRGYASASIGEKGLLDAKASFGLARSGITTEKFYANLVDIHMELPPALGAEWEKNVLAAVKLNLSSAGLAGGDKIKIDSKPGYVSYGPGIGVGFYERGSWNFSFEIHLPQGATA